jgi:cytosine/adenosine deaminase-related metal-dependent hydrolase
MNRTLIRGARVLTMASRPGEEDKDDLGEADILVEDGRITAIGRGLTADAELIDGRGMLATPGLINAHLHSPANFMRGTLEGLPLELFMLYEVPPLAEAPPGGREAYVRTMLGAMEMLKLGITSVMDDAFHVPRPTHAAIDGIMQAYSDSGIRATVTLDQPNIVEYEKYPFLAQLLPEEIKARMDAATIPTSDDLLAHYAHLIGRWHCAAGGRLRAGVSCSAPQRVTEAYFRALSGLSKAHDLPFVVHILETKLQRVYGEEKLGRSLVRYVNDLGLLDERMQVVHSIWVDDDDIRLLADAGCTVAHNPVCNLKLGSGIMPFRRLQQHGVPICLGTDEAVADDSHNLWLAAKMAGLIHKISDPDYRNWPTAAEVLACLFTGGARAMRLAGEIGVLKPGAQADIILLDLNTFAFTPLNDLKRQLVYCETGSSVRLTMVAGDVVMRDGKLTMVDEDALKREARAFHEGRRDMLLQADAEARRLDPFYREMYLRAAARDVGMNRWAGPMEP